MILNLLRERTGHLHARIEQTVNVADRLRSITTYAQLLARFHGFYSPLEDRLATVFASGELDLDFAERRKAHLLRDDLMRIGMARADVEALPRCRDLPVVTGPGDALGCLYVLEGATLGGQVVRRMAEQTLGLRPDCGYSFFTSYGERVGAMWAAFRGVLEAYAAAAPPAASDRIVATAVETFAGLDRWVAGGDA